ncbi:MAG TPA: cytochrome c peroxidase [Kofleriaceae bacterium]|nr:cytochrome c peroxidase [Kofleriaceae bacterium]
MSSLPLVAVMMSAAACGVGAGEPQDDVKTDPIVALSGSSGGGGSGGGGGGGLRPLSSEPVPRPTGGHIVDQAAAVRLGKALFWDIQTGGDGQTACASCHFVAGADDRRLNTLNPGLDGRFASGGVTGPGQTLAPSNLVNDDRVGSQGVAATQFTGIDPDPTHAADLCTATPTAPFADQRQVTGRNAPTVIGAVFFRDAFWDGRANHIFNGSDPFGQTGNAGTALTAVGNSALASQAVGPAVNPVEMSCLERPFNHGGIGTKLLARPPLQFQQVATTDGVLGALANPAGPGLLCGGAPCSYGELITAAFGDALAAGAEDSFSMIWGEAVQAYEATLIPDQTPLDRYLAGDSSALTSQQQRGLDRFQGKGNCTKCHAGALLSDATVSFFAASGAVNRDGGDQGFHNLGVRPTAEDLGRAGAPTDPPGVPFSVSGSAFDRGAFKTPGLRNVKLTAPYFHNGGKATLADVVAFYTRGGDFANPERARDLQPRSFDAGDQAALVDFLTNGLTDCRVEQQRAPFDHPALPVPDRASGLPAVGATGLGSCP